MTSDPDASGARLSLARALLVAIETGDEATEVAMLEGLGQLHGHPAHAELKNIATELRQALCNTQVGEDLSRLAHRELPDAQLGLNQVIELTEEAAHQTLSAVEAAFPLVDRIDSRAQALGGSAREDLQGLRELLAEVLTAQGFQDITGQIIRRVVELVSRLEAALAAGGDGSGAAPPLAVDLRRGTGPALPGRSDTVAGQQDVDDLLSELGV